jgi:hypothetical protein
MTPDERPRAARINLLARLLSATLSVGHVIYYVVMGLVFAVALVLGIGAAVDGAQPTYWGTFTQHSCEPGFRGSCIGVGTWVSESGSMVKRHIQLDGFVGSNGEARASYTPTGFNNDAENNFVHVSVSTGAQFWFPWAAAILVAGLVVLQMRNWRRKRTHHHPPEHAAQQP